MDEHSAEEVKIEKKIAVLEQKLQEVRKGIF